MKYRLGLDMGTSSIGWAIDSLSEDNTPVDVIDMGVRIFDGGRNPKTYESLAVERRIARGIRRMRDRRIGRKKRIIFSEFAGSRNKGCIFAAPQNWIRCFGA